MCVGGVLFRGLEGGPQIPNYLTPHIPNPYKNYPSNPPKNYPSNPKFQMFGSILLNY